MPATPAAAGPDTSVCARCGAGLRCGVVAGDADCWCFQLPQVIAVPGAGGAGLTPDAPSPTDNITAPSATAGTDRAAACLCPACLQRLLHDRHHANDAAPARD